MGLHAVKFGHNYLDEKNSEAAKVGRGLRSESNLAVKGIFEFNYFQIGAGGGRITC